LEDLPVSTLLGLWGLGIGLAFGAVTRWGDFCVLGSLADIVIYGDYRRLRAWLLAVAVAMLGVHALHGAGALELGRSLYLSPALGWLGAILGGLMFGYGTVMARGCGGRTLIRVGGGDLRSLVALIFLGIFAYMTLRGFTGLGREWLEGLTDIQLAGSQGMPELLAATMGLDPGHGRMAAAAFVAAGLLGFCFKDAAFRGTPLYVLSGAAVGLLVAAGWAVTGIVGADPFEPAPLLSISFARPVGDGLQYLMTFTGATVSFGIAVVGGVIAGAFLVARADGTFRLRGFTAPEEMLDYMAGGALMGMGGVLALGCTIGQGITGLSTLSLGSVLAMAAILAGGWIASKRFDLDPAKESLRPAALA